MTAPLEELLAIMERLRSADGCPWDRAQTFASIAPHAIEEAYEVADAVERGDMTHLQDELGDLLFQVVFQAQLAREAGHFDFDAVAAAIRDKLVRRHPHVFGLDAFGNAQAGPLGPNSPAAGTPGTGMSGAGAPAAGASAAATPAGRAPAIGAHATETPAAGKLAAGTPAAGTPAGTNAEIMRQSAVWEDIKARERASTAQGALDGVPQTLPALLRAFKLSKRAARVGFDFPNVAATADKVVEELAEVREAAENHGAEDTSREVFEEVGDLLFAAANLARKLNVDAEAALRAANRKFERRFRSMERLAAERGGNFETSSLAAQEALWQEVKRAE